MNSHRDDDIQDELRFHMEAEQEERELAGMSPDQARLAARRDLGNPTLLAETLRGTRQLETLLQDLRYGIRGMRKDPVFSLAALLCLMLGIGANTAVFSTINAYLIRNLPYREPERLAAVFEQRPREGVERNVVSYADFWDWREQSRSFDGLAGYEPATFNYTGSEPRSLRGAVVTANFFAVLGVQPWRGMFFRAEDKVRVRQASWCRTPFGSAVSGWTRKLSGAPFPSTAAPCAWWVFCPRTLSRRFADGTFTIPCSSTQRRAAIAPITASPSSVGYVQGSRWRARPPIWARSRSAWNLLIR
jgi:hypothetical protein